MLIFFILFRFMYLPQITTLIVKHYKDLTRFKKMLFDINVFFNHKTSINTSGPGCSKHR